MENNTQLSPPWFIYRSMLEVMFEQDPEIDVLDMVENDDSYIVEIETSNMKKYEALVELLKKEVNFGHVKLTVKVTHIPDKYKETPGDLFKNLFEGNPIFKEVKSSSSPMQPKGYDFVIFKKEVLQFYDDDISDPKGFTSMLAEDIARKIFNVKLPFTTEVE